jgi:hypothetical protein
VSPARTPVAQDHLQQVLAAGGLVPTAAKLPAGDAGAVDTVVARAYQHRALPGRTVVRLTAENVVAGDDLEMSVLGFGPGADRGAVGKERRRALGFPGWALVHDPKNARYALDVVGELKKHARKAKSKPGHAKDGIDALGLKLGKQVPQFLPSFFEEAGRAFIEHGAPSFAAVMFAKAREAEAVHALDVDEQHRVDAFLEFALAGAVTTKALTEYAKDLGEHHAPKDAYEHFRQLCVQRTLGGMPPWAGMAKDLRRLAKAAKLDPDAEDARLVADIVGSPALSKAAGEFWRAYQPAIVAFGKRSAAARGALLNLFPTGSGSGSGAELDELWLEMLEQTGATASLVGEVADEDARPNGGRAIWFDKLVAHLGRRWRVDSPSARPFALLRAMAQALVRDGKPIACINRWRRIDLDLVELALELGVVVAPVNANFDLDSWATVAGVAEHGRDPVRVAAHATLGPLLVDAVSRAIGGQSFDDASRGKPGFAAAKRAWIDGLLTRAEQGGLPALEEVLDTFDNKVRATTFAEQPEQFARFAALDLAPILARSLRIGLIDELGWPAFEDACKELDPDGKTPYWLHGSVAAAVVATKTRAIAVGPTGRLGVHDLVVPAKHEVVAIRFIGGVGGQFLVLLKENWKARAYWSSAPHDVFDTETAVWGLATVAPRGCAMADGAWREGVKPIRVGDRAWPTGAIAACDGTTAWVSEWKDGRQVWRELSEAGEPGRASWPAVIEAELPAGWFVDALDSYVMRAPDGLARSPLGLRDGLLALRMHYRPGEPHKAHLARTITRVDGKTWTAPLTVRTTNVLELPSGELRGVTQAGTPGLPAACIVDADGTIGSKIVVTAPRYWRGSAYAYPEVMWHLLSPRDAVGSAKLRATTDADARALLAGGAPVGVTHPKLVAGVGGLVEIATALGALRDKLRTERAPGAAAAGGGAARAEPSGPSDVELEPALGGWSEMQWGGHRGSSTVKQIAGAGAWLRSDDRSDRRGDLDTHARVAWPLLAVAPSALTWLARAFAATPEHRRVLRALRDVLARELPDPAKLRVFSGERTVEANDDFSKLVVETRWEGGNAYIVSREGWSQTNVRVLEYAPSGAWRAPRHITVGREVRGVPSAGAAEDGEPMTLAGAARLAELTGLSPSAAVYLLAGCPKMESRDANFLDKELREQLGLKATQATLARSALIAIPVAARLQAIAEAARTGCTVDALAAAWAARVGKRVAVPEDLIATATAELRAPISANVALPMLASGDEATQLTKVVGDNAFNAQVLQTAIAYLPFVLAELPVGHELRARMVRVHALLLERLADPALAMHAGQFTVSADELAGVDAIVRSLGGTEAPGKDDHQRVRSVPGAAITTKRYTYGTPPIEAMSVAIDLKPAELDARTTAALAPVVANLPYLAQSAWAFVSAIRGDDFAALTARVAATPVPVGGWEQSPLASAGKLVDRAAKGLAVSRDAAALYLQYLTLMWPTPKLVQQWNGWTSKHFTAANAELIAKELVIEAKRERAGRAHFLPGGWEAMKSPHPPFETWKLPMYGKGNLGNFQLTAPFHVAFERAWKRIEDGDVPKYEDVRR